jgi:hypothetical protein
MNKKMALVALIAVIVVLLVSFSNHNEKTGKTPATNFPYTTSCGTEEALPTGLSKEYKDGYIKMCQWLGEKIDELKPAQYKPMLFTGFHLPISYELYPYTNSADDIKFLDMLNELDVDVVGVGIRAPESHTSAQLERFDALFNEVRKRNLKLKIWYFGGAFNSKAEYIEKGYRATKDIIERWHPDYYTIVHEPTTQERAYNFEMSPEEWQEYIRKSGDIAKGIYPNVKTGVTVVNSASDIKYIDYFVQIPNLDNVGFDIYNTWGLCNDPICNGGNALEQKIDLIQSHGKKVWIEETWLSTQWKRPKTDPPQRFEGFDQSNRAIWDAKWMRFITYYAQKHNIEAVEPFFTNYFILYPDYDPYLNEEKYIKDYKKALYDGKRTPTFYELEDVIKEVKQK